MTRSEEFRKGVVEAKGSLSPGDSVLVDEACRLIDRLDRFDALISGDAKTWVSLKLPRRDDGPIELGISSVVSEARQTVSELRQVVKAIEGTKAASKAKPAAPTKLQVLLGGGG